MNFDLSKPIQGRSTPGPSAKLLGILRVLVRGDRRSKPTSNQSSLFARNPDRRCRRASPRSRLRLMSGKVVNDKLSFLVECTFLDHSSNGCRLRLARDIPLPCKFNVYLDSDASILIVAPIWRRGTHVGLRLVDRVVAPKGERSSIKWRALGQPYYAID